MPLSLNMSAHNDDAQSISTDVVIIGAGPVGLTIANLLGLQGVRVVIIENLEKLIEYPRAIGLDDEALRVFQSAGLVNEILPHTTPNHWMRFTLNGHCFASIEPRTDEFGWSRRNAFLQPETDRILYDGLARFKHVQVLFSHTVANFSQDDTGVSIEVDDGKGQRKSIRAGWMVGADGGNSFVRRSLDIPFLGRTKANQWIVIDVRNDPIGSPHIYLHCDAKRPYVSAALPHGIRRFEFMVMPGETEEELSRPGNMAALIRSAVSDPDKVDYIRKRVYTHNARLASTFRSKRVLLAGDAAHIMPVWQGQGYNSGIRDANNLAWKLALVVKGAAGEALLDTYTTERRAHAGAMIHLSEVAGDIFAPTSRIGRFVRNVFVRTLNLFPKTKKYFVEMRFKPMPRYESGVVLSAERQQRDGLLARVLANSGQSAPGRMLGLMSEKRDSFLGRLVHGRDPSCNSPIGRMFIQPFVRREDHSRVLLDDAIGNRFAILSWGTDPTYALTPEARAIWACLDGCFIIVKPETQMGFTDDVSPGVVVVGDADGRLKEWFEKQDKSVVLLRPDRFVAGMCSPQKVSQGIMHLADKLAFQLARTSQTPFVERPSTHTVMQEEKALVQL